MKNILKFPETHLLGEIDSKEAEFNKMKKLKEGAEKHLQNLNNSPPHIIIIKKHGTTKKQKTSLGRRKEPSKTTYCYQPTHCYQQ